MDPQEGNFVDSCPPVDRQTDKRAVKPNSEYIVRLRQEKGWSQEKLAAVSGISKKTIERLETGKERAFPDTLGVIAEHLGVEPKDLIVDREPPRPPRTESLATTMEVPELTQSAFSFGQNRLPSPLLQIPIGRDDDLCQLKSRLGVVGQSAVSGVLVLTAIRGLAGVGKTTFATMLAYDPQVRAAFSEPPLWASLGLDPDLLAILDSWARQLGVNDLLIETPLKPRRASSPTIDQQRLLQASQRMAALLQDRNVLIIVDDVWNLAHATPLLVGGCRCATLICTRQPGIANHLVSPEHVYHLNTLDDEAALAVLRRWAPDVVALHEQDCRVLASELEGLPLALIVAGKMLNRDASRKRSVQDLLRELHDGVNLLNEPGPIEMIDILNQTIPTVAVLLRKSIDRLDAATRERFAWLGVVKEKPATFGVDFLHDQWQDPNPRPTIDTLVDFGLIEPVGGERFQMHMLFVAAARSMLSK